MALRDWLQTFVTAGALAWSIEIAVPSTANAQAPAKDPAAAASAPAAAGEVPRLPDVNVVAEPPVPQVNLQPNFEPFTGETLAADNVFTSPPFEGYYGGSSSTGSLLNMPDLRFPGTVSVVGKDLIRDQQALRMNDVLRDIGGAVQTTNDQLRPDSFLLRGLEVTSQNYRKNGFLDPTYTPRDFANVERIDVFKGPSSMLYGPSNPSGTVNVITKKAMQDRFAFGGVTFGSYGLNRYVADVNSMNAAQDVLFRVNTAYENRSGFQDNYYNNRTFIAPTISFLLSEDTVVTVEGEFLEDNRRFNSGIISANGNTRAYPKDMFYGTLSDVQHFRDYRGQVSLVHQLNDDWQFYLGGQTLFFEFPSQGTVPSPFLVAPPPVPPIPAPGTFYTGATPLFRTQSTATGAKEMSSGVITNLSGRFDTGPIVHNVIGGFEGNWRSTANEEFMQGGQSGELLFFPGFSPYANGTYGGGTVPGTFTAGYPSFRQTRFGFYQQDFMELTDRVSVMLSQRFDTVQTVTNSNFQFPPGNVLQSSYSDDTINRWSPRAGLVYELVPGALSSYAVYTKSFQPPTGGATGPLPELGTIWEGGFKVNIYENLAFTAGGFWIERANTPVRINNLPTYYQSGVQRSQGVELGLAGQWTDRLSTASNYTYNDVLQTGYENFVDGSSNGRVLGVPFNLANVWTRYNLIQERDRVLGVGLGWVYVGGNRRGDYNSPLQLGSYNRLDLGFYGQLKRWTMDTYIENIFNEDYDTGSISQFQVYPGAPVNFRMQVGVMF